MSKNHFSKTERKNKICINVFCYESKLTFPIYISDQKIENSIDLLLIFNGDKSNCFHKTKNKNKKYFCKSCLQCFSSKNVLAEHMINGVQSVRSEKGTIEFKNLFKQILAPFKMYSDFECILISVESHEGSCSKNIKITFLVVLLTNLFALMTSLASQFFFTEVKILFINLLKQFLKGMNTVKK